MDYNHLALCSGAYRKPTHRGSKGYKRKHNIRQRIKYRTFYKNIIPITPAKRTTNKASKQLPNIMLINCRALTLNKLDELKLVFEQKEPKIVMITESWLNESKETSR